ARWKSKDKLGIEILLYRLMVGGFKAKCEMHFLDGKLFYYVIRFSQIDEQEKAILKNTIQFKYLQGLDEELPDGAVILDQKGDSLLIDNGINLNLHYSSEDEVIQHLMEYELDLKTARFERKQRRRQLELMYTL
ncbi:MAG: hypothetical protein KDC92_09465, partial [Bacteroidetes bacterium]|nr:hypothetical protein [Bacteroidota bacterium]